MEQDRILTRILKAAQTWGRERYGQPVTVECCGELQTGDNGMITAEVEVHPAQAGTAVPRVAARALCIVTLEPDGTLGCIGKDAAEKAQDVYDDS